jgi:hypothetical protein
LNRGASVKQCLTQGSGQESLPPRRIIWLEANVTEEDLKAELERLRAENETLKNRGSKGISLKVSEKGAVSVYGLGRFPVTLYKEQWLRLLEMTDEIRAFIKENDSKLKTKQ